MKTLKLNVALAISIAAILDVSGYVGYTGDDAKSHISLSSCDNPMDDHCDGV